MKKLKSLLLLITVFGFLFATIGTAKALGISADEKCSSPKKTLEAYPGQTVSTTLDLCTKANVTGAEIPWNYNDISKKVTIDVAGANGFTAVADKKIVIYVATEDGVAPTKGVLSVATLNITVPKTAKAGDTIEVVFDKGLMFPAGDDADDVDTAKITLTINVIAEPKVDPEPVPTDPGDEEEKQTELGYGIKTEKGETIDSKYDKVTPKGGAETATSTTAKIKIPAVTTDAKCYLYRSTSKDSGYKLITSEAFDCSKEYIFTDKDLTPGTTYYYRVRVVGGKNLSEAIEVTTLKADAEPANPSDGGSNGGNNPTDGKDGKIKADVDTGVVIPIAIISALGIGFITVRRVTKGKAFFRI